jgi:8-amino-7-oxononanoate synthase
MLVVDEAHATGVLGDRGGGLTELLRTRLSVDADKLIKVGTLSKALGSQGGFVCGPRSLIELLINRARPYIFSTALPPPAAAAARCALGIVAEEPERRRRLSQLGELLRGQLRSASFAGSGSCQIVPVVVGKSRAAMRLSAQLQEHGFLVPAIRPPSVPEGTARLRISLTAGHSEEDIIRLVSALQVSAAGK